MEVVGRLGELDLQASISAPSTGRYQIDERDANECSSDSIPVDEKNGLGSLQVDLCFSILICSVLSKVIKFTTGTTICNKHALMMRCVQHSRPWTAQNLT